MTMIRTYSLALLTALPVRAAPRAEEGRCDLRVATGPRGKVYEKLFADMRSVCGEEVSLCAVPSEGGLQNLSLLAASQRDADFLRRKVAKLDESRGERPVSVGPHITACSRFGST